MPIAIRYLKISNYRSIDELELHDIPAFAVFAGANGSGKSNFFDALDFASLAVRFDAKEALQRHGGWENIRCAKSEQSREDVFSFEIESNTINNEINKLEFEIYNNTCRFTIPQEAIVEKIIGHANFASKKEDFFKLLDKIAEQKAIIEKITSHANFASKKEDFFKLLDKIVNRELEIGKSTLNLRLFRIEPRDIKESNMSIHDDSELQRYGQNLAAVLRRLEKDDEVRETIIDWLQLIVPQLEIVQTETERLSGSAQLAFKETGTDKLFPAHLISDGTIYLLCLLVAMLDRPKIGITLIEEPERGLHPKAIMELVKGFREHATIESPIWLTTHSESVVRMLKDNELWLVDKKDGKTQINPVRNIENLQLNLDEAWLSNALNGGLPW